MPPRDLLPRRGRPAARLLLSVVRPLTGEDVLRFATQGGRAIAVPAIQRIKAIHHRQAALLAQGLQVQEVAIRVGSTPQRITQLQRDPTFCELVAYYREQVTDTTIEAGQRIQETLIEVTEVAAIEIRDRLEDDAARRDMSTDTLRRLVEMGGDRTVAPTKAADKIPSPPAQITFNIQGPRAKPALVVDNEEQGDE